jgi:protein-S-isoprenylcysteine O-methyltransferase Ste14
MSPSFAKAVVVAGTLATAAIRAPYGRRSGRRRVLNSRRGAVETLLLSLAWLAFLLPLVWVVAPVFAFADYTLRPVLLVAGTLCLSAGLWLFARSHAVLGSNWSITLELRESHELVTRGAYRLVRHPMYSGLLLYAMGQALVLPNWLVGPSDLAVVLVLCAFRIGPEERMLREHFGDEYDGYMQRTKRLVPFLW